MPDSGAEWVIEEGIGETRALLVEHEKVLAAKLYWPGELWRGQVATAQLMSKRSGARRGVATLGTGTQVLVDKLPRDLTEGQSFALRISRAAIAERGRFKLATGRYAGDTAPENAPGGPFEALQGRVVTAFAPGQWEDVWASASHGIMEFAGGAIVVSATPAMTVIDIDCAQPDDAFSNAVPAIATALRWWDIGGNIGIDFPTTPDKRDRKAYDERIAEHLADWPHERTAMNGFGFVQLVAALDGPSLLHRFATSGTGMCARFALRAGERAVGTGPTLLLKVHPALKAKLKPEWIGELGRRTGRQVRIETDPGLALEAPQAQILGV